MSRIGGSVSRWSVGRWVSRPVRPSSTYHMPIFKIVEIGVMTNTKNGKRLVVIGIVAIVIGLGYFIGPMLFDTFLAMHGL